MIMIAGLMKEDKRQDVTGLPGLSRIPVIGALFGARSHLNKKTEIIVFLTPHIITGAVPSKDSQTIKVFTPDIIPQDFGDALIEEKLNEIKVKSVDLSQEDELANLIISANGAHKAPIAVSAGAPENPPIDIQSKIKGIKKED
jgi:Flp pilus assembly secretin CpaC